MGHRILVLLTLFLTSTSSWAQINWKRSEGNPILPVPAQPLCYAIEPSVLYDSLTQVYRMWYCSYYCGTSLSISTATSSDGETWVPYSGNPVLTTGGPTAWDSRTIWAAEVVQVYGLYYMFYSGWDGAHIQIGLAKSLDGLAWQKDPSNPVLRVGNSNAWDRDHVTYARVHYEGNRFMLWYDGRLGETISVGLATSPNGRIWTKHPANPVLSHAAAGHWDDRWRAPGAIVHEGSRYLMMYLGRGASQDRPQYGLALSNDGASWTIPHSAPIFGSGPPGQWDDNNLGGGTLRKVGAYFVLWYGARNASSGSWKIGVASAHTRDFPSADLRQSVEMKTSTVTIESVHPYPARAIARVHYRLARPVPVLGTILNSMGQEISTVIDQFQETGEHMIEIDGHALASGMYWIRLRAGSEYQTQRFVIVK
jgi:predicted GH43/DUF377 family glycosyl hydrolase